MLTRWRVVVTPSMGREQTVNVAAPDKDRATDLACHAVMNGRSDTLVWNVKIETMEPSAHNVTRDILYVYYVDLEKPDHPENVVRRECPVCAAGMLLMRRNPETLEIEPQDRCILCGQRIHYMDVEVIRHVS